MFFVVYKNHVSVTEINPFQDCSVTENTTEIDHTGKLIFFIRGGIIVERIIFYHFNQYVCFYRDIVWKRLIYVC